MKSLFVLILSSVVVGMTASAAVPSQSLPLVWNRSADWVAKKNPGPDSKGNLVWHVHQRRGCCRGGLSSTWNTTWQGWVYPGATGYYGTAGPVSRSTLYQRTLGNLFRRYLTIRPEVWFRNNTGRSFLLKIDGTLGVSWTAKAKPAFPSALVKIEFMDWSKSNKVTTLYSSTFAKPGSGSGTSVTVNIPTFRVDPKDTVRYWISASRSTTTDSYVSLNDTKLRFVRKSKALATETVRNASPKNPLILSKGRTSRPIVGKTWDPYLANSPTGATANLLAIGATRQHIATPFGTLLTDLLVILSGAPGKDFAIAIPSNASLVGIVGSVQGAAVTSTGSILLSNALDIRVGDF